MRRGALLVVAALTAAGNARAEEAWEGLAVGVAGGHTIGVLRGRQWLCVRLHGVDSFGREARDHTFSRLLTQVTVRQGGVQRPVYLAGRVTVAPVRVDERGRVLARVYRGGRCLNDELLEAGLGWHDKKAAPDRRYAELEAKARAAGRGLWSAKEKPWRTRERIRFGSHHVDPMGPDPFEVVTVRDTGPVRANPLTKAFHLPGCEAFLCADCTVQLDGPQAAVRAGYRPHRCVRYVPLDFGPPPDPGRSKEGVCRSHRDCVFSHHACSPCPACSPSWGSVTNRKTYLREQAHYRRHRVKCAPCAPCPCGQSLHLGTRAVCIKGQCAAR